MRRVLPVLVSLIVLAGCEGGAPAGGPPQAAGAPTGAVAQVRAWFPPHGVVDTIVVSAVERLPLRAAELIAPDGTATPAGYVNSEPAPRVAVGQWGTSHSWQDSVSGNNALAALALPSGVGQAALRSDQQLLAIASTADIPLPDPVLYRRDWQHYRIRLVFGPTPDQQESQEISAPAPPATE